jgi:hypothetical protein
LAEPSPADEPVLTIEAVALLYQVEELLEGEPS